MKNVRLIFFLSLICINSGITQPLQRSVALMDMTQRNSESNQSRLFSAEQMLQVAGIPFYTTEDLEEAMNHSMIFFASQLIGNSFETDEIILLQQYVSDGGLLIAPRVLDEEFFPLFGIDTLASSNVNYQINWSDTAAPNIFRWNDEPEEWTISLGKESTGPIMKSYEYQLAGAQALAHYENNAVAVAQYQYGNGFSYAFGVAWKDVIHRSQINRDYEAQRITSNGFEPTQDVLMLLIRSIFCEHVPFTVWKHTSPYNSTSTVMITHDIDSSTGMDTMSFFSEYEKSMNIQATYNITTRYFSDAIMTDFYNGNHTKVDQLKTDGHIIGSHSVGHFPDFADDATFPFGSLSNTPQNYQPYNDGVQTVGGTVFGECQVSKNELQSNHNVGVLTFRAGHLAYNKYLAEALDLLNYQYNSSNSASDVLTHFPYRNVTGRSFSGLRTDVFELPVTISDIFHQDGMLLSNYLEKVGIWLDVFSKVDANNASTVLLIHPNRMYKLWAQEYFIAQLPESVHIEEMTSFGKYWKTRLVFDFQTELLGDELYIIIPDEVLPLDEALSLIVNNGQDLSAIIIKDNNGNIIDELEMENWEDNDIILFTQKAVVASNFINHDLLPNVKLYPNPVVDNLNVELTLDIKSPVEIELYDLLGNRIYHHATSSYSPGKHTINLNFYEHAISHGIYICKVKARENGEYIERLVF